MTFYNRVLTTQPSYLGGYFQFNNSLADASPNALEVDFSLENGMGYTTGGIDGTACLNLNGGRIQFGNNLEDELDSRGMFTSGSVAFWLKPATGELSHSPTPNFATFFYYDSTSVPVLFKVQTQRLDTTYVDDEVNIILTDKNDIDYQITVPMIEDEWAFLTVTWNGTLTSVYKNAVLIGTSTHNGFINDPVGNSSIVLNNITSLFAGNGSFDELVFYAGIALDQNDVLFLFNGLNSNFARSVWGINPENLLSYYALNGNVDDSSPNLITGASLTNSPIFVGNGINLTQALQTTNSPSIQYFLAGSNWVSEATATAVFSKGTAAIWFKADQGTLTSDSLFQLFRLAATGTNYFMLRTQRNGGGYADNEMSFIIVSGGTFTDTQISGISEEEWHLLSFNWDGSNADVYFDGIFHATVSYGGHGSTALALYYSNTVGAWKGLIDECPIWYDYELTASEHLELFNSGNYVINVPILIDGENLPPASVIIWNREGTPIAKIQPEIDYITWTRNGIGKASVNLAKSQYDSTVIVPGHRISINYNNGLEFWGGIILPNFKFQKGFISFLANSGEYLLSQRRTERGRYFSAGATVGEIGSTLLQEANDILPTGIEIGDIWTGGNTHFPAYHFKNILEIFQKSLFSRLSLSDFFIVPFVNDSGLLRFQLHILERRGEEKSNVGFFEAGNIADPISHSWEGKIVNDWAIIGRGNDWGSSRLVVYATNQASIDKYGLSQDSEIQQNVESEVTLQSIANNLLERTAYPYKTLSFNHKNAPPGLFSEIRIGDIVPAILPSYEVNGQVEIFAKSYSPRNGKQDLVIRLLQ